MKFVQSCELCWSHLARHKHHKLSQTKVYRKIYGKLLDEPFNIMLLCEDCHLNKPVPKYTEKEFREEAMKHGHVNLPMSKTLKLEALNG